VSARAFAAGALAALAALTAAAAPAAAQQRLGDPVDVAADFQQVDQTYFMASRVARFDAATGAGVLQWDRYARQPGLNFNKLDPAFVRAQDKASSARGWPMMRALFFEHPSDPASWPVDDEYLFGSDLLVAPLFEEGAAGRRVYVPPGTWFDYQTGRAYPGGRWHDVAAGPVPVVLLVRDHAAVPHVAVAQHTGAIDWRRVELRAFSSDGAPAEGLFALPDGARVPLRVEGGRLARDPLGGWVAWRVTAGATR
jgi:hypothetical protein